MRIALTGARGLLGTELVRVMGGRHVVLPFDVEEFDVSDAAATSAALSAVRPDAVVHAAAWTAVDDCEGDPDRARRVNVNGTASVADAARAAGAQLLTISTDYVFDGELPVGSAYVETDETGPLSVYGRSKLEAEGVARSTIPACVVVRTQALFGAAGGSFVDSVLRAARAGKPLRVVDDQWTCPTYAPHLAAEITRMLDEGVEGVHHVSAAGSCTWLDLARAILEETGIRGDEEVVPISSETLDRPAPRPRNGALDNRRLRHTIGDRMPPWRAGLRAYLREGRASA